MYNLYILSVNIIPPLFQMLGNERNKISIRCIQYHIQQSVLNEGQGRGILNPTMVEVVGDELLILLIYLFS